MTLSVTSPLPSATISGATAVNTSASSDIVRVELSVDNVLKATDVAAPFNFNLDTTTLTNGSHTITTVGYNSAWQMRIVSVPVTVNNAAPGGITLSVTSPSSGAVLSGVTSIATSVSSNVVRVEFSVDNVLKGTDTTSPFSFNLDTTALTNAAHTITVVAYDASWNMKILTIPVTVSNGSSGVTLSVSSPASGATVAGVVSITTSVSSNVVRVEFYLDNVLRGTDLSAPFTFALDTRTIANGAHSLTVVAYDASWNMKIVSQPLTIHN